MKFLALTLLAAAGLCHGGKPAAPSPLDWIKKLEGSWVALDEKGQPTQQVTNVFRVTAAGTAVEETCFPGTEHEMVTLYFVRDGKLQLTHYCMAGNQPHMIAQPSKSADELDFVCDGTGVSSEDEGHMHHAVMKLSADGKLESRWQMIEKGKETYLAQLTLVRKGK